MNKYLILLLLFGLRTFMSDAQNDSSTLEIEPVQKGDYKILKLDALNLMGLGVQKLHLGYEISPMPQNKNNLPTINFNLTIPFNSLDEVEINYGLEAGAELRFYQRKRHQKILFAEGGYVGVGIDGGYVNFNVLDSYTSNVAGIGKETLNEYQRVRTGIFFLFGAQSKLGEKLYFDVNMGIGWSNVNVKQVNPELNSIFIKREHSFKPFYLQYREGKSQRIYIPVSFGLGYNFGNK